MDLSDGLADGVRQVAEASGVGAIVEADTVPVADAARLYFRLAGEDPVLAAIAGGDDYELLFTVSRRAKGRLATVIRQSRGVTVTRIGRITRERDVALARGGGLEPLPPGFVHF
jgi:thiamine-monophosphate kinase